MEKEKEKVCVRCSLPIKAEQLYTICHGFCTDVYHAKCANLFPADVMSFKRNSGFLWMCESCRKLLHQIRNDGTFLTKQSSPAPNPINKPLVSPSVSPLNISEHDLKEEIRELREQFQVMQQSIADLSLSRAVCSSVQENVPLARSSPKCNTELLHGSKLSAEVNAEKHSDTQQGKFWMFFTRIKNTVSEDQILQMASQVVGSKDIIVKRLVSDWKDISLLPYVSFKVGMDAKYRDVAMISSNWPDGICYREFYNDYKLWEPL